MVFLVAAKVLHVLETGVTLLVSKITKFYNVTIYSEIGKFIGSESFTMLSMQFIFLMWAIRIRYQHINNILQKVYVQNRSNLEKFSPKLTIESIKKLSILHDKLIDISDMTSFCYGVPVSDL